MMILKVLGAVFGSKQDRDMRKLRPIVEEVTASRNPCIRSPTNN